MSKVSTMSTYMPIRSASLHGDSHILLLPSIPLIGAFLALLCSVLLEHAWPKLSSHYLVLALALPLALGGLDYILIPHNLHSNPQRLRPCFLFLGSS